MSIYRYLFTLLLVLCAFGSSTAIDTPYLLVLNKSDNTCWQIEAETGQKVASYPTGTGPHEIAVSPNKKWAIVTNYGNQEAGHSLTLLNLERQTVASTIDIAPYTRPHGIAWFNDSRRVMVTSETRQAILIVDIIQKKVLRSFPTQQQLSHMVALDSSGHRAYVSNIGSGSVSFINVKRDTASQPFHILNTGKGTEGIELVPSHNQLWVTNRSSGTLSVIDLSVNRVVDTVESPGFPIRLDATADGKRMAVTHAKSSEVAIFDISSRDEVSRISLTYQPGETDKERFIGNRFGDGAVPIGLTFSNDGKTLFVSASKADQIAVIDTRSWKITRSFAAGTEPDGIAFFRK